VGQQVVEVVSERQRRYETWWWLLRAALDSWRLSSWLVDVEGVTRSGQTASRWEREESLGGCGVC
jgi:hypothetical protein